VTALILIVLALLDTAAAGFRDAAGRNGLLDKRGYYRRAARLGALLGLLPIAFIASVVLGLTWWSADPTLWPDFLRAGEAMTWVYGPTATLVAVAMGIYLSPRFEVRSLATVIILGPFTLLRPVVITGGAVVGVLAAPRWEVAVACCAVIIAMAPFGWYLNLGRVNQLSLAALVELR
jgi:hypothetical protein